MKDLDVASKPTCLDESTDAQPFLGQEGVRTTTVRRPWRRPGLKVLAVEETKTSNGVASEGHQSNHFS